jgi:hypothetical protein
MEILILAFIIVPVLLPGVFLMQKYNGFNASSYKAASGNSFFKTIFESGNNGEYLTFSYLEKLEGYNKLMTNLYIPKKDGSTTEIDLIMLSEKGIYVFESKNYSGWIFGDETSRNWTQTLQNKQKNRFFNPIWQNKGHISALKSVIEIDNDNFYKSYVIFSERCTLKKISITSPNVKVINRYDLIRSVKDDIESSPRILSKEDLDELYAQLLKYSNAEDAVKTARIGN